MINQRMFDHYGIDTKKDLAIRGARCPRPFDTVLIDKTGSCYACECTAWLPQSIGNLQIQPLSEIIGNARHQHIQSTIEDGTYRLCNEHQCSYIQAGVFNASNWIDQRRQAGRPLVRTIRLAIDDSCNLRCPSCRPSMIFHKEGSAYQRGRRLADRVNQWLQSYPEPVTVQIGSDGDPFASQVYRYFMQNTPHRDTVDYQILTNGLLFEEFRTQVPHVISRLTQLGVSMDGASQRTYEQLRLGGNWHKILANLTAIQSLRQQQEFKFHIHFVVQRDNYHEMMAIIDLAEHYGADKIYLNRIEDWNVMNKFEQQNIWHTEHYQQCLQQVIKRQQSQSRRFIECATLLPHLS